MVLSLHFAVEYGKEKEEEFVDFQMQLASEYVRANLKHVMNDHDLLESIYYLKQMFIGGTTKIQICFSQLFIRIHNSYTDMMWSLWKLYKPRKPGL